MLIRFVILGLVVGGAAFAFTEYQRTRRLSLRTRVLRDGVATTARVQAIWERGKNARGREVLVRFVDVRGHGHEVSVIINPAELGAAKARVGGDVGIHYLPFEPGELVIDRPEVLDDKIWVSMAAGAVVFGLCIAIGTFLR